jgi:hypothetical protein
MLECLLLFALLTWSLTLRAMDLTHYDLDSLVYLSTDIVVAKISVDAQKGLSATVTKSLYGSLHSGDRVEQLSPFLSFFRPMEDGMNVILFLDRRPHTYDFIHSDVTKALFAVPPSGVYFIDNEMHVHQYYQQSNPGPYVAQGYSFFHHTRMPSQEEDLKLPSLAETEKRIAASIESVGVLRPFLDKTPIREDIPKLFTLLNARKESGIGCGFRAGDAIVERLTTQIRSFNDPELLLRLRTITVDFSSDISFVQQNTNQDAAFTLSRVAYLLRILSDRKAEATLRMAAAETLLGVNMFHSGVQGRPARTWLIDNVWLANSADQIRATARDIFYNIKENVELRGLCLQFLPLDDAKTVSDVRKAHSQTHSYELRYAIEDAFLQVSDSLYQTLDAPGGPVTSIILAADRQTCVRATPGLTAFMVKYRQRQDFHDTAAFARSGYTLTNIKTGQRIAPLEVRQLGGWSGVNDGEGSFELTEVSDIAPGKYALSRELSRDGKILSSGYPITISVTDTPNGRRVVVNSRN